MSKEVGAGGRFDIFLDSGEKNTLLPSNSLSGLSRPIKVAGLLIM